MPPALSAFANDLLRTLLSSEDGLSNDQLKAFFPGDKYLSLPGGINELLAANRLQIFTSTAHEASGAAAGNNSLVYKAIREEVAAKLDGLTPEQILIFQIIEKAGNKGIWTRDIKVASSIPQQSLTKALKLLEQRMLIKSIRSVVSKSKKLYVLFDLEPAKEITGGPWYSDQEFDHEFVTALGEYIYRVVEAKSMVDLDTIAKEIKRSGICKIELSTEETELIVNTLVYDGRLEEVQSSVLLMSGYAVGKRFYKASNVIDGLDHLTAVPCGVCPVVSRCCEGGIISPTSCPYLSAWLDNSNSNMQVDGGYDDIQSMAALW